MNLSRPYAGIARTVDGDVLVALAGTDRPSTGRQVARLVRRGSQPVVNAALTRLVEHGLVRREAAPPAMLFTLNRDHVGFAAVEALAGMRTEFLRRLRAVFSQWEIAPVHASMFGSAARADGDVRSDVDLVVVRPHDVDEDDERWQAQLGALRDAVSTWTGNAASIVELAEEALPALVMSSPRVLVEWRQEAVELAGRSLVETLGPAS